MNRTTLLTACSTLLLTLAAQPAANAAPVVNPANGHYYDAVLTLTNWHAAKAIAEAQCYRGLPGHLVTITTQEENDFIVANFPQVKGTQFEEYWIGAFQPPASPEPGGNWQWITGEQFSFPNWSSGEPNNAGGNEDAAHFYAGLRDGRWNDRPATDSMAGYVIEYEPLRPRIQPAVEIVFPTRQGAQYQLQVSTDFNAWTDFGPLVPGTGAEQGVLASTRPSPKQFFRVEPIDLLCGLAAHHPFNGNADDVSGNGNQGTVTGGAFTTNRFGQPNAACQLDGTGNSFVTAPDSPSLNITNALTLAAWIWANSWQGNSRIIDKGNFFGDQYWLIVSDRGELWFHLRGASSPELLAAAPPIATWHHVVATYDGTSMKLFVDGVLTTQQASIGFINAGSGGRLGIGIKPDGGGDYEAFDGVIDDVRIYNRALSVREISQLFNATE